MKERLFTRAMGKRQLDLAPLKVGEMVEVGKYDQSKRQAYYMAAKSLDIKIAVRTIGGLMMIWRVK